MVFPESMLASVVYDCLVTPYLNVHCKLCNLPSDPKEKAQAGFWLSDKRTVRFV